MSTAHLAFGFIFDLTSYVCFCACFFLLGEFLFVLLSVFYGHRCLEEQLDRYGLRSFIPTAGVADTPGGDLHSTKCTLFYEFEMMSTIDPPTSAGHTYPQLRQRLEQVKYSSGKNELPAMCSSEISPLKRSLRALEEGGGKETEGQSTHSLTGSLQHAQRRGVCRI